MTCSAEHAEKAVLGAILIDPSLYDSVRGELEPADFTRDLHRLTWRAFERIHLAGRVIDLVTVREELRHSRGFTEMTGAEALLAALVDGVPKSQRIASYASIVKAEAQKRRALQAVGRFMQRAREESDLGELRKYLEDAREELVEKGVPPRSEDCAEVLARTPSRTPWLVEGLLAVGDIAFLSGSGGIGKSWLGYAIAVELCRGNALFGRYRVTRPCRVAILDLETRSWELDQRLHRIAAGLGVQSDQIRGGIQVIRERLHLDDNCDMGRLAAGIRTWNSDLLVVDSFRRAFRGDENSSQGCSEFFSRHLDPLRLETGCGVLFIDHNRKPTGDRDLDASEVALRGSSDKRNLADAHFGVEKREEHIAFVPSKTRHARLPDPILLRIEGLEEDSEDGDAVVVVCLGKLDRASDRVQDAIIELLQAAGEHGMHRGEIIGQCNYSERSISEALRALKNRGLVSSQRDGRTARYCIIERTPRQ